MRYRAVFFDAGETLVHPHPSFPELLARIVGEFGHPIDPKLIGDRMHVVTERFSRAATENELWSTTADRSRTFWTEVYTILLEALEIPWSEEMAERLYRTFTDVSNYRLFDDVLPALEKLETDGYELGLISNFEEWLEMLLEHLDVTRFFDVRVISGVEGVEKPDPRIFRLALDRSGVAASEAAYVGDNLYFDIEPATAVGMRGVLLDRRRRYSEAHVLRIESLEELPEALSE